MTKNKQEEKPGCAGKDKRGGDRLEWDIKKKKKNMSNYLRGLVRAVGFAKDQNRRRT